MQPTRDSSVWRSLAVAFGDGVAFGVGMKLIQPPKRPAAPAPEFHAVADRLEFLERRLGEIDLARAQSPAIAAPLPSGTFDQKVLEAVVNALDARLHEHAGQVERRLTELEAKFAIELQSLHKQDQSVANGLQAMIAQLQQQFESRLAEVRESEQALHQRLRPELETVIREASAIPRLLEQRTAELHNEIETIRAEAAAAPALVEQRAAELQQDVELQLAEFRRSEEAFRHQLKPELESVIREVAAIPRLLEQRTAETREELLGEIHAMQSDAASIAQMVDQRTGDLRAEVEAVRTEAAAVPAILEQHTAVLQQRIEGNRHELHSEIQAARSEAAALVRPLEDRLKAEVRDGIGRAANLIASSSDAAVQQRLAPIQQRTMQSERALIELLKGIGTVCREAAENMTLPDQSGPGGSPPPPEDEETIETIEASPSKPQPQPPPTETPADPATPLPSFAQSAEKPSKLWRIPLVSSLAAIGGFVGSYLSMR